MTAAFKYIDDDLQNLKQLINFRIEDVIPQHNSHSHKSHFGNSNHSGEQLPFGRGNSDSPKESKPPFHYSDLIEFALRDKNQMTVSEIYDWILFKFPYFKNIDESRWKPAVRHTLTTNSSFYKAKKANRGFLWAYRAPGQRKPEPILPEPNHDTPKSYNWKKRLCGLQSTFDEGPKTPATSPHSLRTDSSPTQRNTSSTECQTDALDKVLPIIPTLTHCNKTIILGSEDSDSDETCGECTCKVEYFIPRLPSELNLNSSSATCIPCCKGVHCKADNHSCCLAVDGIQQDQDSEWNEIWSKVHGRNHGDKPTQRDQEHSYPLQSSSATRLLLPSKSEQGATQGSKYLLLTHIPSVKESKSGHMICLPISVPMYKKSALMKKMDKTAKLHEVSQAVAVAESGLFERNTDVMTVPSSQSVCGSISNGNIQSDLFDNI